MSALKRIGSNTMLLYLRFISVIISMLIATRLVIDKVGLVDFGVFSVASSIVAFVGFIQSALSLAAQRYFSHKIGEDKQSEIPVVLTSLLILNIFVITIVAILVLTLGNYLIHDFLNIPSDRKDAAYFTLYTSVVVFSSNIISAVFIAFFISSEKISIHIIISVLDAFLKLLAAAVFQYLPYDLLVSYASLLAVESVFILIVYSVMSRRTFSYARLTRVKDIGEFRKIISFVGWNLWGSLAVVFKIQGVNVLLNVYFGPAVNSARTISLQINAALTSAIQSLQTALSPYVIKNYAAGESSNFNRAVLVGAKYNFLFLLLISTPFYIMGPFIISFWLGQIPDYSIIFLKLAITVSLVDSLSSTLITAAQATGKIRKYQLVVGGVVLLELPFNAGALYFGGEPYIVGLIAIIISMIALYARLVIIPTLINLERNRFIRKVIFPISSVYIVSFILSNMIYYYEISSFISVLFLSIIVFFVQLSMIYYFAMTREEKGFALKGLRFLGNKIACRKI
ncbi:MATE family efflux transporter [Ferrimonas balearica]|uniref:MATE family efflux transporter n=1 Tax=Ferrimonas balearica TaxID=44012 RepID=UPI001F38F588|nr:MATE family efflux transporter [Ferrimonas balearica]MBY6018278.1 MATE family efflux transporter [Halomonas denitrificans]MBY6094618.1 MATE family efflux transporter [Ferrimonas balearica]